MSGVVAAGLLADRGEACVEEEFFRSAAYFEAEGVTHTLQLGSAGAEMLAPLVVRGIEGTQMLDAVSPYGYPGFGGDYPASPVDPAAIDWSATGLVSAFLRHRLVPEQPPLAAASRRIDVQIASPDSPPKSRMSDRQQIRRNLRRGWEVGLTPGPETDAGQRAGFLAAYEQTMRRAGAGERYFFGAGYFERILGSGLSWLALAIAPGGQVAAGSVAVRSDSMIHYYLSGTADAFLRDSPMKNVVASLIDFASGLGLPLNLGGGLRPRDRLEEFKRGFANHEQPWYTSGLICDAPAYERLAAGRDSADFFPAYRAD